MYNVIEITNEQFGRNISLFKNYRSYILVKYSGRTFRDWKDKEKFILFIDDIEEILDIRHLDDSVEIHLDTSNFGKKLYIDIEKEVSDELSGWVFVESTISFEDYETARLFLETY